MDDLALKKHRLLLDLLALEGEFIRVMKLNSDDKLKQAVGGVRDAIPFEQANARRVASDIYGKIRAQIIKQDPDYANTMLRYSDTSDKLNEMGKALSLNPNPTYDTALRKLLSVTRNNVNTNYGARADSVGHLAQYEPDLPPAIAGKAMNSWLPRGLARLPSIEAGLGFGLGKFANPAMLAALPLFSPRMVGEAANAAGRVASYVVPPRAAAAAAPAVAAAPRTANAGYALAALPMALASEQDAEDRSLHDRQTRGPDTPDSLPRYSAGGNTMEKRVKVLHGKKRKGYADGGAPDAPDTSDALPNLDFLRMVTENPRGWGNGPPPLPQTAMQKDPGAFQGEIRNIARPGEYLAPAEQGAADVMANTGPGLPALPGIGAAARALANPKVAGALAAGAGMLAAMPEASTAGDSPKQQLEQQRAQLVEQQQAAFKRREANADSPGKLWTQANKEYQDATGQIANVDQKLKDYANSPAGQQEVANEAARLKQAAADKLARTPFRERNPEIAQTLPIAGWAASLGLPALARSKAAIGSWFPGSYAGRIRNAQAAFDDALASGNAQLADIHRAELKNLVDAEPSIIDKSWKGLTAAGGAGAVGAEAGTFPDIADAYGSMPEGPEKDAARRRLADIQAHAIRMGFGTVAGLGGYKAGALMPERTPDVTGAAARVSPWTSDTLPPVRVLLKSKAGLHGEDGRFVKDPRLTEE